MSTMVLECPVLNPHILRRASVVVGRFFGDVPGGDISFFSPDSHLFNLFTAVPVYSLGNTLEIGAAALDSGYR